jgi:asparagine synthase (glutamine-hydrolysing)
MCGIAGVLRLQSSVPVDRGALLGMCDAIRHRGPDAEGVFVSGPVGLGHRRLSIIDLSTGAQPMASADGAIWLTYNGEIYNFRDLRSELEAKGHRFRTTSDTEVIIAAYEAFGEAFLDRLRGMFAFALWDARRNELLLVRDRLGIKPLYYTVQDGVLIFASEIKAILRWPGVARRVNVAALEEYLQYRYVPGPATMFEGIDKLPPGHVLRVRDGDVSIRCYWDLPLDGETLRPDRAERELRERVEECVERHLISDVPVGVFLSGGVDSTVITALMSRSVRAPVESFSIGYDTAADTDERPFARLAADRFGTVHRAVDLDPKEFWQSLATLLWHLDEPVADPAALPLYVLSRFARRFVTVLLSGEGADELLAGYGIYPRMLALERMSLFAALLGYVRPLMTHRKLQRYVDWAQRPLEHRYRGVSGLFGEIDRRRLLNAALQDTNRTDRMAPYFDRTERLDPLRRMLYFDLKVWLPDDLLIKADKTTMAASIELRVPFLDHTLVEWLWRLPSDLKLRGSTGKYLLRQATRDLVPRPILERRKRGFAVPLREWFRDGLAGGVRALLEDTGVGAILNATEVNALIARQEHRREDLSPELFGIAVLALWYHAFIESPSPEPPCPDALMELCDA